jgi:hypothetical protein
MVLNFKKCLSPFVYQLKIQIKPVLSWDKIVEVQNFSGRARLKCLYKSIYEVLGLLIFFHSLRAFADAAKNSFFLQFLKCSRTCAQRPPSGL